MSKCKNSPKGTSIGDFSLPIYETVNKRRSDVKITWWNTCSGSNLQYHSSTLCHNEHQQSVNHNLSVFTFIVIRNISEAKLWETENLSAWYVQNSAPVLCVCVFCMVSTSLVLKRVLNQPLLVNFFPQRGADYFKMGLSQKWQLAGVASSKKISLL